MTTPAPSAPDPGVSTPAASSPAGPAPTGPAPAASAPTGSAASAPAGSAPAASSGAAPSAALSKEEAAALQLALRSENTAIWAYALVAANDPDDAAVIADMRAGHLVRRDATAEQLLLGGVAPAAPAPAYRVPAATDPKTARSLAAAIEKDCAAAWRGVVAQTDRGDLRSFGAGGLSDAAVRTVQWNQLAKAGTVSTPFPGTAG